MAPACSCHDFRPAQGTRRTLSAEHDACSNVRDLSMLHRVAWQAGQRP